MTNTSHDDLVGLMRDVPSRPGGTGALLNLVRSAVVRAAADQAALSELATSPGLQLALSHQAADAAGHARMLLQRLSELDFRPFRVPPELDRVDGLLARCRARDVRDVYAARGTVGDAEAMELVVAASISKKAASTELRISHDALAGDSVTQTILGTLLRDDARHIAALDEWMRWFECRFSRRAVTAVRDRLERVFAEVDAAYRCALPAYFGRAAELAERPTLPLAYAIGQ